MFEWRSFITHHMHVCECARQETTNKMEWFLVTYPMRPYRCYRTLVHCRRSHIRRHR